MMSECKYTKYIDMKEKQKTDRLILKKLIISFPFRKIYYNRNLITFLKREICILTDEWVQKISSVFTHAIFLFSYNII